MTQFLMYLAIIAGLVWLALWGDHKIAIWYATKKHIERTERK